MHFTQSDTLVITGDRLEYNSVMRSAVIEGDVKLNDQSMQLTTDQLNYDLAKKMGYLQHRRAYR